MARYMLPTLINFYLRIRCMAIADEQHHTPLPETLKITKLTLNGEKTFLGNIDIPWIKEILSELEREYFEINAEENDNSSSNLIIDLSVIRKKNDEFGDDLINEQLFLNIPQFPLHDENCRGLCPICGTNLNHDSCSCQRPED